MPFEFEERPSDSPFVESIWRTESGDVGRFLSVAVSHWELVFMRRRGETLVTLRGPETKVSWADCPDDAEFFGMQFKLGSFMPAHPVSGLVDAPRDLPLTSASRFRLDGSSWELPAFDNADAFLARLEREGLLVHDPVVQDALAGREPDLSPRTLQRRFLDATGLPHRDIRQIERARRAAKRLREGEPIASVVESEHFADQPHLTRSLRRLIGQTPVEIARRSMDLSLG